MLARVRSFILHGIDAVPCEIEVNLDPVGMDRQTVVGLPDAAVKESIERVRAAMTNSGYSFPMGTLLVNLAPADVKKEGPIYDLPIAVGILIAAGVIPSRPRAPAPAAGGGGGGGVAADSESGPDVRSLVFAGELALDGRLRPIRGAIALASLAASTGARGVVVPAANGNEAAVVERIEAFAPATLTEVVGLLTGDLESAPVPPPDVGAMLESASAETDFVDVRGQEAVKRALTVAAAGGHNLLMLGPPGTGKTMMARALPGILPPLTTDEALEITRIYSAAGRVPGEAGLVTSRPVRTPHHTASAPAIVGGGVVPRPGEVSLAHHGVLFLDELPEFPRDVLETLRQPLEDHVITIARAHSAVRFPASFMLVAAMNPSPKGDKAVDEVSRRAQDRYLSRLSGPLIDRIDIHVEAPAVPWKQLSSAPKGSSSAEMRERVLAARDRQARRQGPGTPNSRLSGRQLDSFAPIDEDALAILGQAITELGLSARAYDKIRRVARTVADIDGQEPVGVAHVGEAIQYRLLDRRV